MIIQVVLKVLSVNVSPGASARNYAVYSLLPVHYFVSLET